MRFDIREPFAFAFTFTRALSRYAVSSRSRMTKRASRMARK